MRITSDSQLVKDIVVYLNGEIVGSVIAADDEEGWVDQILTNPYREFIGYPKAASREEEMQVIRRTGKVEIRTITEEYVRMLETFAQRIRSGEMLITNLSQVRPYERWWSKDKWEYFSLQDMTLTLHYHDPKHKQSEIERKETYLKENPNAEGPIVEPPFPKEVQDKLDEAVAKQKQK